jgi:predicted lipid-binding transport protein (Tim44 family)
MENSQLLIIVVAAMVAGVVLFRLYSVLGRRTGNEREPPQPFQRIAGAAPDSTDKVVALPQRTGAKPEAVSDKANDPLSRALTDIKLADRTFEVEHFLAGARHAYEMIVTAYAAGDRAALKPLLSAEVYAAFDGVIGPRETRKEKVTLTFIGIKDAKIVHAALKERTAEVTVSFTSQYITSTSNDSGAIVDGDPKTVRDVVDVWTFARDVRASDPNWTLIATSGGDA